MTKYIEAISIYDSIKDIIDKAFESLYFAIVIDKTGNIIYINNSYADYLGKRKQDLIGTKVEEVIPGTKLYETLQTGEAAFDSLFEFEDGRSLVHSKLPIKNTYGEILGVVSISSLNATDTVNSLYQEINQLKRSNMLFAQQLQGLDDAPSVFDNIVGTSPKIMEIKRILSKVTNSRMPILLTGESGCGKEVFANAMQVREKMPLSLRLTAPQSPVNLWNLNFLVMKQVLSQGPSKAVKPVSLSLQTEEQSSSMKSKNFPLKCSPNFSEFCRNMRLNV